jgi:hypothetical protein
MGGKTQQQTSQQSTTPTNLAGLQSIFNRVQGAAATPFSPFSGELTAPVNAQQQAGIGNINSAAGSAQPYYAKAADYAASGAAPIQSGDVSRLMNPFTQSVINATQANFNEDNGQAQQKLKGQAAMMGALGGSGQGVAAAELARQQQLAQAPVIAQLNSQNYSQAVQAAQADRSAAGNAAGTFGNLGTAAQQAALQGAGAQINAGTLQQQTQQAADAARYGQYQQQQAFPYAQAQFLSQYGTPAALAQGSSTSGSQTSPGPNPLTQILGLGTAALTAFSDKRVKENIEPVGKTFDGQPIYRFNYSGNPMTQIGLIAQDVEHAHPDAVGQSHGIKTVDYESATDDAARRGHFASGGSIGGSPFSITDGVDFIPKGGGAPSGQLNAPALQYFKPTDDGSTAAAGKFAGTAGKAFGSRADSTPTGATFGGYADGNTSGFGSFGGVSYPAFADGGLVSAIHEIHRAIKRSRGGAVGSSPFTSFADGGTVSDDGTLADGFVNGAKSAWEHARWIARRGQGPQPAPYKADGGATFDQRFTGDSPFQVAPVPPVDEPYRLAGPEAMDAWRRGVDTPNPALVADSEPAAGNGPAPAAASANPMLRPTLPKEITGPDDDTPTSALAFDSSPSAQSNPYAPSDAAIASRNDAATSRPSAVAGNGGDGRFGGFNPLGLSDKAREAIISGALGVAASRSPFALSAIGEGGIRGMQAYSAATAAEQEAADKKITQGQNERRINMEAQRIAQSAQEHARDYGLRKRTQDEKGQLTDYQKIQTDLLKRSASLKASEPIEIGTTVAGTPVKALPRFNSATGEYDLYPIGADGRVSDTPVKPGGSIRSPSAARPAGPVPDGTAPPASPAARNETYLKSLADEDAGYAEAVRKAANYEVNPNSYASMRSGQRQKFMNDVLRYDPTYDAATFPARAQAVKDFNSGKKGDMIRSFDVGISHLEILRDLTTALHNRDSQLYNKTANAFKQQFGYPAPTNFEAAKGIVGDEIVKAVVGGQNALGDREEAKANLAKANTPDQIFGVINTYTRLMGGQLHGLKKQYTDTTRLHNFDERLTEQTRAAIAAAERSGESPAGGGDVPPAARREKGKVYTTPRGPMTWTGEGWQAN